MPNLNMTILFKRVSNPDAEQQNKISQRVQQNKIFLIMKVWEKF